MTEKQIEELANRFTGGEPLTEEIEFLNGSVLFHFDNPYEEDLKEDQVVATLLVKKDEFSDFDPTEDLLNDEPSGALDRVDGKIQRGCTNGGFNVDGPDFDTQNTTDSHWAFTYYLR